MFSTIILPEVIIDSHCHGRDLNQSHKTTVLQVLREAKRSGISITAFMPNTDPSITTIPVLEEYIKRIEIARKTLKLFYKQFVYFGATDDNLKQCAEALNYPSVIGIKVYPINKEGKSVTTGSHIGVANDDTIFNLLRLVREKNKVIAFHCDDPSIIKEEGYTIRAETEYVKRVFSIVGQVPNAKIVICHVSSKKSAQLIFNAQKNGIKVVMELMPQYLWFDAENTNWNSEFDSVFYHCFNNLRASKDREFLVKLLASGNRNIIIASDSACHTKREKFEKKFGGIPSNQEMVPVIITLSKKLNLSDERVAQLLSFNASNFFGIPISKELVTVHVRQKIDNLKYNHGAIVNPWQGTKLFFPTNKTKGEF